MALNIREALEKLEEVEIRAFVAPSTTPEDVAQAAGDVASFPESSRRGSSPTRWRQRAQSELGEFRDVLRAVLPGSIDIAAQAVCAIRRP